MSCNLVVERVDSCLNSGLEFFACGPVSLGLVVSVGKEVLLCVVFSDERGEFFRMLVVGYS